MAFRPTAARLSAVLVAATLGLYLLLVGFGLRLQDHRQPEVQSLEMLNDYLKDLESPVRAKVDNCIRVDAAANEKRLGVEFFVNCTAENIGGRGRITLSAAFGSRDQVEYSEISEMQQ